MSKRRSVEYVRERETGLVHYASAPGTDCVTLCQRTDWLGTLGADRDVDGPATCRPCNWIMDYCRSVKL